MIDPIVMSKLSLVQQKEILSIKMKNPEVDVNLLAKIISENLFEGRGLVVSELLRAVETLGPFAVDAGKKLWHFQSGVWRPNGIDELTQRVAFCTGTKYRKEHVAQVCSLLLARDPKIEGLGPRSLINVQNGMLDWRTEKLLPHDAKYFSTYQLQVRWEPSATCPTIINWLDKTIDSNLHSLIWQIIGVTWYPAMGFQQAIALIGGGKNGKGTLLRLCKAALPDSACCAVDPKKLSENRFSSAELFGKTANIVGDIERMTLNSTAEIKKITGEDPVSAERKMGQPFTFISQATNLFAGNRMPKSSDTSFGWFRRWLIVPLERTIQEAPDLDLEPKMHAELEGALVLAVRGLKQAMEQGGFDTPDLVKEASKNYEYSCSSAAYFINESIEFDSRHTTPISRSQLVDAYENFCRSRRLFVESRHRLYELIEDLGAAHIREKWLTRSGASDERGFIGMRIIYALPTY